MKEFVNLEERFRVWLRAQLNEVLADDPQNAGFVSLPVKQLTQICIEEVFLYLVRKNWPSAQKTTAEILEIGKVSVWRAIKILFK